ncbi:uncharacterized protein LOC109947117 [Prunus persica]|uniref:uncharacterized protein LOC109947117 n=1 Tax=Prunus persica TaxID=3760 RepID=UPI0009AB9AD0|nr:uncharacterized protein LOC109947117 [Prunus persica]
MHFRNTIKLSLEGNIIKFLRVRDPYGIWVEGDDLPQIFIKPFKLRFKVDQAPNHHLVTDFLQIVELCVTSQDNVNHLAHVSDFELDYAIKCIGPLKAPGSDRLQADVNHTNIALIPKVNSPKTVNHYRPICLCNVSYKIISKILVNQLRPILSKCISKNRGAFALGRSIFDNILIAHELFHDFKRNKGTRGAMAIKLDLEEGL